MVVAPKIVEMAYTPPSEGLQSKLPAVHWKRWNELGHSDYYSTYLQNLIERSRVLCARNLQSIKLTWAIEILNGPLN